MAYPQICHKPTLCHFSTYTIVNFLVDLVIQTAVNLNLVVSCANLHSDEEEHETNDLEM